jgi:hypothetical protein
MPNVVDTPDGLSPNRTFTRRSMIEFVHRRTKKIGADLDMDGELLTALQELCGEQKWYWRRKSVSFQTEAGNPTYNVADIIEVDGPSIEQLIHVKIKDPSTGKLCQLSPIYDFDAQEDALECTQTGQPGQYFIQPGTSTTIRLVNIPDAIYTIRPSFWAIPVALPEQLGNDIPLLPGHMHWILALLLERNIYRLRLGGEAPEMVTANGLYVAAISRSAVLKDFEDRGDWKNLNTPATRSTQ